MATTAPAMRAVAASISRWSPTGAAGDGGPPTGISPSDTGRPGREDTGPTSQIRQDRHFAISRALRHRQHRGGLRRSQLDDEDAPRSQPRTSLVHQDFDGLESRLTGDEGAAGFVITDFGIESRPF